MSSEAKFSVGQLVRHRLFHYRGVIFDVDPSFQGTEEWYRLMAGTRPPKDRPWYHVLVHEATHTTYVAERNLDPDANGEGIDHPLLDQLFDRLEDGHYLSKQVVN
ncbi:MAG: heat shock protein HspQ [bacterium]|nr:heat shock protein HspQ [bacterium]